MKHNCRNAFLLSWILVLGISLIFSGCSSYESPDKSANTLWVVTELTTSDSFNYQAQIAAEQFTADHPGVSVKIDVLPTDAEERDIYLKQLRAQIMAGKGPDVYILPTSNILTVDSPTQFSQLRLTMQLEVDPLFQDIAQAMHDGIFADIRSFYDADEELNTEGLVQDVMNAGVIGDHRYVLPLRYTMPVLLYDPSASPQTGILPDMDIVDMAKQAISAKDTMMAIGLRLPDDTTLLSRLFDYPKGEVLISKQEIAEYMYLYQQWYALAEPAKNQLITDRLAELEIALTEVYPGLDNVLDATMTTLSLDSFNNVNDFGDFSYHWSTVDFPLYTDTLTGALQQAAISKVLETNLEVHPLKTYDGKTVAEITYYGAIGASCEEPALAYEFLRKFLTEDYQWDFVRPRAPRENISYFNLPNEPQVDGMIENSWPVRVNGSVEYLWDTIKYQLFQHNSGLPFSKSLYRQLKSQCLTDADMPILQTSFDEVRFPLCQPYEESLAYALTLLNNGDGTPTDVDIDALADQVYQYLWWHLAEG